MVEAVVVRGVAVRAVRLAVRLCSAVRKAARQPLVVAGEARARGADGQAGKPLG